MSIIKPFYINDSSILINLSTNLCKTNIEILESVGFRQVLVKLMSGINQNSNRSLWRLVKMVPIVEELIDFYKMLLISPFEGAQIVNPVKEGSIIRPLNKEHDIYALVRDQDGHQGWLEKANFQRITDVIL